METEQFIFLGEPVEQAIIVRIWKEIRKENKWLQRKRHCG